jgi:hypothetical protein
LRVRAIKLPEELEGYDVVQRQSSHRVATYTVLTGEDFFDIPMTTDEAVMGIMINTGAPGSKVKFSSGDRSIVKSLSIFFDRQKPDSFKTIMVDFKPPLKSDSVPILVSLVETGTPITDSTLYEQTPLDGRYGQIEVEGFLIASRKLEVLSSEWQVWDMLNLDILRSLEEAEYLNSIVSLARAT